MTLSNEEREIVVAYRLEKALKALEHAEGNVRLSFVGDLQALLKR